MRPKKHLGVRTVTIKSIHTAVTVGGTFTKPRDERKVKKSSHSWTHYLGTDVCYMCVSWGQRREIEEDNIDIDMTNHASIQVSEQGSETLNKELA